MDAPQVLTLVNAERSVHGLDRLAASPLLEVAALAHARDMAEYRYLSHTGRDGRGAIVRVRRTGYGKGAGAVIVAENIARGRVSAVDIVQLWLGSPGHRANILHPGLRETGIAVVDGEIDRYWVQVFGARS